MHPIYLNQAGTSWPKPDAVQAAVASAFEMPPIATPPGKSIPAESQTKSRAATVNEPRNQSLKQDAVEAWPNNFDRCHQRISNFFGIPDPSRLLLTPGCTSALQLAVEDFPWEPGDRVVTSGLEHHALHRPLLALQNRQIKLEIVPPTQNSPIDLQQLKETLQAGNVRMIAVSAASNVTGDIMPLEQISVLAHRFNAVLLVDGAQVAGWLPIDLPNSGIDLFAFGGHKAMHGIWGIGGLYVSPDITMNTPSAVCDLPRKNGASSASAEHRRITCAPMPGYCDGGSVDRLALNALSAAADWLDSGTHSNTTNNEKHQSKATPQGYVEKQCLAMKNRLAAGRSWIQNLKEYIEDIPGIQFYGFSPLDQRLPTLAFNIAGIRSSEIAMKLTGHGVVVASGLQCAPLAHTHLQTGAEGAVRISVGPMNTREQIPLTALAIREAIAR